jgi:glutathione-specific gamma-glutamylcyclotransferase
VTAAEGDFYVFGYGSLMWRPDFPFAAAYPARLYGWHRRFCIASRIHRGSHHRPGLVLGLDRGGVTDGVVYRIDARDVRAVHAYLRAREQVSGIYREARVTVFRRDGSGAHHQALVYLAERAHPGFTARVPVERQAHIIAGARGHSGSNIDYLVNTLAEFRKCGIRERELERVRTCLGTIRGRQGKSLTSHTRVAGWPQTRRLKLTDINRFVHRLRLAQ